MIIFSNRTHAVPSSLFVMAEHDFSRLSAPLRRPAQTVSSRLYLVLQIYQHSSCPSLSMCGSRAHPAVAAVQAVLEAVAAVQAVFQAVALVLQVVAHVLPFAVASSVAVMPFVRG